MNLEPWLPRRGAALNLALQGGGAHGAFTWGVLDALLEHGRWRFGALSGSSAGALNAVMLAQGLRQGGADAARELLEHFWTRLAACMPVGGAGHAGEELALRPAMHLALQWAQLLSPYQFNPLGLNPMRELLAGLVDFELLRHPAAPRLYIGATHAGSGRLRLFGNADLSLQALHEARSRLVRELWPCGRLPRRVARARLHCVDADEPLRELDGHSRMVVHLGFFQRLRDQGREQALRWMREHGEAVGRRSSMSGWAPASPLHA